MKPIVITCGDPAGIGTEVALRALSQNAARDWPITLIGDLHTWKRAAQLVGSEVSAVPLVDRPAPEGHWGVWTPPDGRLLPMQDPVDPNQEHLAERGRVQTVAIKAAVMACLDGLAAAMVTMPADKRAQQAYGVPHPGQTELIAGLCTAPRPVMMLFGPELRVVPITIHVPLRKVPELLTYELVLETLRIVHADLRRLLGIDQPRLGLCGLNPHAGEGGLFGTEELDVMLPAVRQARKEGIIVRGPLPADTIFTQSKLYDVILCPTHDQALIPLKQINFETGVNATLGLPIVRTSPDHGTARDIAWTSQAKAGSAYWAIRYAAEFAERLHK